MDVENNGSLVAYCGLFCGECGSYLKGKCKGCKEGGGFSRCKVRICCTEKGILTCAECEEYTDFRDCKKLNGAIAKVYSLFSSEDRLGNLEGLK